MHHPRINILSLERKRRRSCCHVKVVDLRKGTNDFFAHSIGEDLIFWQGQPLNNYARKKSSHGTSYCV
jgi:hypothetical protein